MSEKTQVKVFLAAAQVEFLNTLALKRRAEARRSKTPRARFNRSGVISDLIRAWGNDGSPSLRPHMVLEGDEMIPVMLEDDVRAILDDYADTRSTPRAIWETSLIVRSIVEREMARRRNTPLPELRGGKPKKASVRPPTEEVPPANPPS